ncbi:uncharacterized protein LOC122060784 [Macadamia integrifolia]|uniref:uncharacterized protein LOC122060784 n=1 Tax=Macadamia integrifolia TaxID=60698 RepID=UPI001C52F2B6|nr:uncharacterized protein LOC122060784 [Macadamia integrifolia]
MLISYQIFFGISNSFSAKIWSILKGIKLARAKGFQQLWIESDSSVVVSFFHHRLIPWFALQVWNHILSYLNAIVWKISHCYREANPVADFLAKETAKTGTSFDDVSLSLRIRHELAIDEAGRTCFRFLR